MDWVFKMKSREIREVRMSKDRANSDIKNKIQKYKIKAYSDESDS